MARRRRGGAAAAQRARGSARRRRRGGGTHLQLGHRQRRLDPAALHRVRKEDVEEALGELYQIGSSGYPRDAAKAAEWFTKASEQGSAFAASKLGRMLLAGEGVTDGRERNGRRL